MRYVCYTEWWINCLYVIAEMIVLSCEDRVEISYKWEERLSVKEMTEKAEKRREIVPVSSWTEQRCHIML